MKRLWILIFLLCATSALATETQGSFTLKDAQCGADSMKATYLRSTADLICYGGAVTMLLGGGTNIYRSLIFFNQLDDWMAITAAGYNSITWDSALVTLNITGEGMDAGESLYVSAHKIIRSTWIEAGNLGDCGATWDSAYMRYSLLNEDLCTGTAADWGTNGCDNATTDRSNTRETCGGRVDSLWVWSTITTSDNLVFGISGATVTAGLGYGLVFIPRGVVGTVVSVTVGSDDNATASNRPRIQVFYTGTTLNIPVAAFSGTPLAGPTGTCTDTMSVKFTDASTNTPTSWAWTFGDDSTSTAQNPLHKYWQKGVYTVGLTATNADGNDVETKTAYVTVYDCPVANFSSDVSSGSPPTTVVFTDLSTNTPTSWRWYFGDDSTSALKNPTHEYINVGVYDVSLVAINLAGSDSLMVVGKITVAESETTRRRRLLNE